MPGSLPGVLCMATNILDGDAKGIVGNDEGCRVKGGGGSFFSFWAEASCSGDEVVVPPSPLPHSLPSTPLLLRNSF